MPVSVASKTAIERLLRPRSIAVVGGGSWCANVLARCQEIGFDGDLWAVHPTREKLSGITAYRSVDDLPGIPDAAFIGVNRQATVDTLKALNARGAGGAVCFASGFREVQAETGDGDALQDALIAAADDMIILGPNCYGFINYLDGAALWPDQHGGVRSDRGVAVLTQSSNIALNMTMQARGLPLAYIVTLGNQAQTGLSDVARTVLMDERVSALGLHIEGVGDLRGMEAMAAQAHALGKPIIALKAGRSPEARAATISHTASLAGSEAGADALLRRLGIGRVTSVPALLETLKLLHITGPLSSQHVAVLSSSGGEASLFADSLIGHELSLPPLDRTQRNALRETLGSRVALSNPLDYHTYIWDNEDALTATFTAMMQSDHAIGCALLDFPRQDRCDPTAWTPALNAVRRTKKATGRPMAVIASLTETMPEKIATQLIGDGIVPFCGISEAVQAMEVAAFLGQERQQAAPVLQPPSPRQGRLLIEAEAKAILSSYDIRVPRATQVSNAEQAAPAAAELGFPVVLKGEGIAHKTEAGAIALGLASEAAVEAAAQIMRAPRFLIEEMVGNAIVELLIGVVVDEAHGFLLTLAAGGTFTELYDDNVSLLVPASKESVKLALMSLKISPRLTGYRGQEPVDLEAVLDTIMAVQEFVIATQPNEIEINPLLCGSDFAIAVDALVRTGE